MSNGKWSEISEYNILLRWTCLLMCLSIHTCGIYWAVNRSDSKSSFSECILNRNKQLQNSFTAYLNMHWKEIV